MESQIIKLGLNPEIVDKIKCATFNNKSYHGFSGKVLKSGICKYYRRKQFDKFEWCIIEMMIFGLKNKGLLTNVINRIKILLMEEIICYEIGEINSCITILNSMDGCDLTSKIGKMLELCSIVKHVNRGRIVSYINNWWKYNPIEYNLDDVKLNKINKYKKPNDIDEILKYGELFIQYIGERNEKMFDIFNKLYDNTGSYGTRYRRKDAIYLLLEIIEDKYKDNKIFMNIFNFTKTQMFRKDLKERKAFGVWLTLFIWKYDQLDFNIKYEGIKWDESMVLSHMTNRENININETYVVEDFHVNKKFGLANFGNHGSMVIDEDLSVLGGNGEKYRQFYVDIKNGINIPKPPSLEVKEVKPKKKIRFKVKSKTTLNVVNESELKLIDWSKFSNIKVLDKGVCGLKVCCIKVSYKGNSYILKEMKKSFNYGRDYIFIDELKTLFGVDSLKMKRIKSNSGLIQKDKKIKSFVDNWEFAIKDVIYCMMTEFNNIGDIGKHKSYLENPKVFKECLKIRLFDGLFRSSDNILRNILISEEGDVMSIDEGDIYGKRTNIFNKTDWFKKTENIKNTIKIANEILEDWNLENKIEMVKDKMGLYGFNSKIDEMETRFTKYKEIINKELI